MKLASLIGILGIAASVACGGGSTAPAPSPAAPSTAASVPSPQAAAATAVPQPTQTAAPAPTQTLLSPTAARAPIVPTSAPAAPPPQAPPPQAPPPQPPAPPPTVAALPDSQPPPTAIVVHANKLEFDRSTISVRSAAQVSVSFFNDDVGEEHHFEIGGAAEFPRRPTCVGPCTDTYSFRAPAPGVYEFYCVVHTEMGGKLTVAP